MPRPHAVSVAAGKLKKRPRKPPIHLRRKATAERGPQPEVKQPSNGPLDFAAVIAASPLTRHTPGPAAITAALGHLAPRGFHTLAAAFAAAK